MMILPSTLDFSKYKRYFAFGCSFTLYRWPTWSHMLHREMSDVPHYNFGRSGAGNLLISNRIVEADMRYKFSEEDLVVVMWSTFCREDRWVDSRGGWIHPGNIYTQDEYDEKFVMKYCDPLGYLLRDVSLISMANVYMEKSHADFLSLISVPFTYQQNIDDHRVQEIIDIYHHLKDHPPSLFDLGMKQEWSTGHEYYSDHHKGIFKDYHPDPSRYWDYLEKIGIPLTDKSRTYAVKSTELLLSTRTEQDIHSQNFNDSVITLKML